MEEQEISETGATPTENVLVAKTAENTEDTSHEEPHNPDNTETLPLGTSTSTSTLTSTNAEPHMEPFDTEVPRGRVSTSPANEQLPLSRDSSTSSVKSTSSNRPKRYKCGICENAYARPSALQQHMRVHTGEKPFQCTVCNELFTRKDHLVRHGLKHMSEEEKPLHCGTCGKGCNSMQHLKRHERIHEKSYKCSYCEETFFKHQTLKHHVSSLHEKNPLVCVHCNKSFTRPYRLANHKLKQHNESPGYQCTFPGCFRNFKTWSVLSLHLKTDHPRLVCKICGKGCIGSTGLEMHMKIHDVDKKEETEPEQVRCVDEHLTKSSDEQVDILLSPPLSLKEFPTAKRRKVVKLPDVPIGEITEMIANNVEQRTIPCKYKNCHRLFKKDFDLERHLKWHSVMDRKLTQSGETT